MIVHLTGIAVTGLLIVLGAFLSRDTPRWAAIAVAGCALAWLLAEWYFWPANPCPRCGAARRHFRVRRAWRPRRRYYACSRCGCKMDGQGNDTGGTVLTYGQWRALPRDLRWGVVLVMVAVFAAALTLAIALGLVKRALSGLFAF